MSHTVPELLCPAGNEEALRAAVDCGADAVYLGCKAFGARASAVNFDEEALLRAVAYAHLYRARVYVTLNTLIKPGEMSAARQMLSLVEASGADAVIVQDLGLASVAAREFPRLRLHASTQMALCGAADARAARSLGFDRVVLARECSLDDIRSACDTGVEIEVFAHGALCTAVSGRCLMSSMSGGRSGNRGRCAQPCRQCFELNGREGPLLSLRDLCLLDDLPALCEAGVTSLKLEGRLKGPEYVAVVTEVYRRALDAVAEGTFQAGGSLDREKLLQIYNRGGFTRGHAMGAQDAALVTPARVSHEGVAMGELLSVSKGLAKFRPLRDLHDGDSLQLRGRSESDLRYSGHEVPAGEMATLRLRPDIQARAGMAVYRLSDAAQLAHARAHQPAPIPARLTATFELGKPMRLQMTDGETAVAVEGPVVEAARSRVSDETDARKQLEKLGETPFVPQKTDVALRGEVFLPLSALNALRRDAADRLQEARSRAFSLPQRQPFVAEPLSRPAGAGIGAQTLAVLFSKASLAKPLMDAGATLLIFNPVDCAPRALEADLNALPEGAWLRLPPQLAQTDWQRLTPVLERYRSRLGGLMAESLSQLALPISLPVLAGEGVPVTNGEGVRVLERMGACGFTLWPEWTGAEQRALEPCSLPRLLKVYGRETLMLLNHCPHRARLGLTKARESCQLCASQRMVCGSEAAVLRDRKGYAFPLTRTRLARGCEIQVLGALPTDLRAYDAARRALRAGMLLRFTTESDPEQLELTALFAALLRGESVPPPSVPSTSGHWLRGVE